MLVKDAKGNELLEIISVDENTAQAKYSPVSHALAVIKFGNDYLMGWNNWRKDWEIFGGMIEEGESLRECVSRECNEELGITNAQFTYLGLLKFNLAPSCFNKKWHIEYGGLFGVSFPAESFDLIKNSVGDKDEIGEVNLYSQLSKEEKIAEIDEKLLEYWK
jgi:8-oxo-dGTP diphosphatase